MPLRAVLLGLLLALAGSQALGHARLIHSEPEDGGTLAAAAGAVTLEFSEGIEPRFSDFALHFLGDDRDAAVGEDTRLPRQAPILDDSNRRVELPLPGDAEPGWYALDWEVLSVDGHTTSGSLRFKLAD